jgi:hypothetical protein
VDLSWQVPAVTCAAVLALGWRFLNGGPGPRGRVCQSVHGQASWAVRSPAHPRQRALRPEFPRQEVKRAPRTAPSISCSARGHRPRRGRQGSRRCRRVAPRSLRFSPRLPSHELALGLACGTAGRSPSTSMADASEQPRYSLIARGRHPPGAWPTRRGGCGVPTASGCRRRGPSRECPSRRDSTGSARP